MKILDEISLRKMLANRKKCRLCLGKGYVLVIVPHLDATKLRLVVPCGCVRQVVRIDEDG